MPATQRRQWVPGSTAVLLIASCVVAAQGSVPGSASEVTPTSITRTCTDETYGALDFVRRVARNESKAQLARIPKAGVRQLFMGKW